jgi:hypothetical protein
MFKNFEHFQTVDLRNIDLQENETGLLSMYCHSSISSKTSTPSRRTSIGLMKLDLEKAYQVKSMSFWFSSTNKIG